MDLKYLAMGLAGLVVLVVGVYVGTQLDGQSLLGASGTTIEQIYEFKNGIFAGKSRQFTINELGQLTSSASTTFSGPFTMSSTLTVGGEITLSNCGSATWNPGSLASSSVDGISATSTDIAVAGAALGDVCVGSLTSATSTNAIFSCNISNTATGTITLLNTGSAALDLVTGTAKICYFD